MPLLHPALSYCEIDGRFVFLDLAGDRYFSLEGELAEALRAAAAGRAAESQVDRLRLQGILVDEGGGPIAPCAHGPCTASLLDQAPNSISPWRPGWHALTTIQTRRRLRREGLARTAERFARRKKELRDRPAPIAEPAAIAAIAAIAADFSRLDLFVTTHDQCLPRSLALGFHLLARGFAPSLVFGVRLGPFRAHCWLECGDRLVNDRYERVRHYRAIRRL